MTAAPDQVWLEYWQTLPEGRLLFRQETQEYIRNLRATVPIEPGAVVLDYGCGYGGSAQLLSPHVREILFWDASSKMCEIAARSTQHVTNARLWDRRQSGIDLILVNSVVQYMNEALLIAEIGHWRTVLNPGGRVVISDLSMTNHSSHSDLRSLLTFSIRRGYLVHALRQTLAERDRYNHTVAKRPLMRVNPEWLEKVSSQAGFAVSWLARNLTHFRGRRTALLTGRP